MISNELSAHQVNLAVPRQWSTRHHPAPGVILVSRARVVPPSGFRPELTVCSQPVDVDRDDWRASSLDVLAAQVAHLEVEDDDAFDLNGHLVDYRRYAHLVRLVDVVGEQWTWLVEAAAITLTCSVAREDYLDYGDVFEQVAATVEVTAHVAA